MNSTVPYSTARGLRTLLDSVAGGGVDLPAADTETTGREHLGSHWTPVLVAAIGIALSSLAHYATPPSLFLWHIVFQRLDPFFTTKQHGTGLRLSISYQIASQHNGAIRVERNASKGMTFSVILPLRQRRLS